jgi:hypothetical protein
MARAAKLLSKLIAIQRRRVKNLQVFKVTGLRGDHVLLARTMTTFTRHPGNQMVYL